VDPDPDLESGSGYGSRRAKMTHKNCKNSEISCAGCSLLRAKGSFCSLNFLYGGLGIIM
jgi:hypothetical protein